MKEVMPEEPLSIPLTCPHHLLPHLPGICVSNNGALKAHCDQKLSDTGIVWLVPQRKVVLHQSVALQQQCVRKEASMTHIRREN